MDGLQTLVAVEIVILYLFSLQKLKKLLCYEVLHKIFQLMGAHSMTSRKFTKQPILRRMKFQIPTNWFIFQSWRCQKLIGDRPGTHPCKELAQCISACSHLIVRNIEEFHIKSSILLTSRNCFALVIRNANSTDWSWEVAWAHAPTQLLSQLAFIHGAVKSVHHFVFLQPTRVTLTTINQSFSRTLTSNPSAYSPSRIRIKRAERQD